MANARYLRAVRARGAYAQYLRATPIKSTVLEGWVVLATAQVGMALARVSYKLLPAEALVHYKGQILDKNRTLASYDIFEDMMVHDKYYYYDYYYS